ncbi:MAG TPA: ATP-binding cassette domain-containing protein [Planctomycetota bacterium]|nr:ATP-binding cassette domain-containing protein [Planctomycetota bacterium]
MIEVTDLTKRYGSLLALRGISFSVPRGQVVGFLGPNGAGKTTTMKILTGYLAPTSGSATVAGVDVTSDPLPALRRIGYLPTENPLYDELRVQETLRFAAEMHGLRGAAREDAVDRSLKAVGLEDRRRQTCGTLSHGYRQRVGLAQALLHEPEVLILDEPTSGLDPNQQQEMRALIRDLGRERTVVLSTHILPEVEAVCDRALIIHRGALVADGSVTEIRAGRRASVAMTVRGTPAAARAAFAGLEGFDEVEALPLEGAPDHVRVRLHGAADRDACERAAARAVARGLAISSLAPDVASLEQVFADLTSSDESPAEVARA